MLGEMIGLGLLALAVHKAAKAKAPKGSKRAAALAAQYAKATKVFTAALAKAKAIQEKRAQRRGAAAAKKAARKAKLHGMGQDDGGLPDFYGGGQYIVPGETAINEPAGAGLVTANLPGGPEGSGGEYGTYQYDAWKSDITGPQIDPMDWASPSASSSSEAAFSQAMTNVGPVSDASGGASESTKSSQLSPVTVGDASAANVVKNITVSAWRDGMLGANTRFSDDLATADLSSQASLNQAVREAVSAHIWCQALYDRLATQANAIQVGTNPTPADQQALTFMFTVRKSLEALPGTKAGADVAIPGASATELQGYLKDAQAIKYAVAQTAIALGVSKDLLKSDPTLKNLKGLEGCQDGLLSGISF